MTKIQKFSDQFKAKVALEALYEAQVKATGIEVIVYEPVIEDERFFGSCVIRKLDAFKAEADGIVANRMPDDIVDMAEKVFTRDLFGAN